MGRRALMGFIPISLGGTARSISKARMSVKSIALILIHRQRRFKKILERDADGYEGKKRLTPQVQIGNPYKLEVPQ